MYVLFLMYLIMNIVLRFKLANFLTRNIKAQDDVLFLIRYLQVLEFLQRDVSSHCLIYIKLDLIQNQKINQHCVVYKLLTNKATTYDMHCLCIGQRGVHIGSNYSKASHMKIKHTYPIKQPSQ